MTLPLWPDTLPRCFLTSGYGEAAADNVITDGYNVGPPAYRRRTTAGPAPYMGNMHLTSAEWDELSTFFHGTLFDGVMRFLFPPQGSTDEARFWVSRFVAPPQRRALGGDDSWLVSLSLERLFVAQAFLFTPLFSEPDIFYAPTVSGGVFIPGGFLETEAGATILTEAGAPIELEDVAGPDIIETEGGSPLETEAGDEIETE